MAVATFGMLQAVGSTIITRNIDHGLLVSPEGNLESLALFGLGLVLQKAGSAMPPEIVATIELTPSASATASAGDDTDNFHRRF
jgi:hypothetical protein